MGNKIAVITTDFPADGHPSFIFVEQLVNAMVDYGEEVIVIAPQSITRHLLRGVPDLPKESEVITKRGNKYIICRPKYISLGICPKWIKKIVSYFRNRAIVKILKPINKVDVLYAHFWDNAMSVYKFANDNKLPLFVACGEGDDALEDLNSSLIDAQRQELRNAVKGVISVSSENKRKCLTYNLVESDNIEVFPNCVNTDLFSPIDSSCLKKDLGIGEDDFTIAFVGGFIHRKGAKRVAEAITSLHDSHIKSIFIGKELVGDSEIPECEGIVFKGSLDHDDIAKYLNCADVFVLPTLKEGCCNAIVEALSVGLPIISSNGSFNDDIIDESNSIRIDPMDVGAIAAAIKKMKEDIEFRNNLKQNITESHNQYSIEGRAHRILDFINKRK